MRNLRQPGDHHFSVDKISAVFERMRNAVFPNGIKDKDFKRFLFAVQHFERYPAKEAKAGRPPRFERNLLFSASARLNVVLEQETGGRISLLYFISSCSPVLDYPSDRFWLRL
jgi:hypothetical protein